MKKKHILFVIILALSFSILACNLTGGDSKPAESETTSQSEKPQDDSSDDDTQDTEDISTKETEWSSEIPEIFPEFTDGVLIVSNFETEDNVWVLGFLEVVMDEVEDYKDLLLDQDWILEDEEGSTFFELAKEDKTITIMVGAEENGSHFVSVYLAGEDTNQGHPDSELNYDNMGGEMPSDYPSDDVPLNLTDATLIGAQSIDADGTQVYSIVYGINRPQEEVSTEIKTMIEASIASGTGQIRDIMGMMYMGNVNGWDFNIAIGDGTADGFTTLVTYLVTEN